jgi:hypothetical protein
MSSVKPAASPGSAMHRVKMGGRCLQNLCNQQSVEDTQEARHDADGLHRQHIAVKSIGDVLFEQELLVRTREFAKSLGCTNVDVVCLVVILLILPLPLA